MRHVCREWRDIALNTPNLSTVICLTRLECVQEMIERSKSLPIHVFDSQGGRRLQPDEAYAVFGLIMTHFPRIVKATFETWCGSAIDSSVVLNTSPLSTTSALRSLTCKSGNSRHNIADPFPSGIIVFPDLAYPYLTHLRCSRIYLDSLHNMISPSLRHFELHHPPSFVLDDLLAALESMQALDTLILRVVCDEAPSSHYQPVTLPHLQKLSISSIVPDLGICIFQHIVYPATASVGIFLHAEAFRKDGPLLSELQLKLAGTGTLGTPPEPQSVEILSTRDEKCITFWSQPRPMEDSKHWDNRRTFDSSPSPYLMIRAPTTQDWISNFLRYLPLTNIRTIYLVERNMQPHPLDLGRTVLLMPHLEELFVSYEVYDDVDQTPGILELPGRALTTSTPEHLQTLFPQLRALHLVEHRQHHGIVGHIPFESDLRNVAERLVDLQEQGDSRFSDLHVARESFSHPDSRFIPGCTCEFCFDYSRRRPSQSFSTTGLPVNLVPSTSSWARRLTCGLI